MVPVGVRNRDRGSYITDSGFAQVEPPAVVDAKCITAGPIGEKIAAHPAGQGRLSRVASLNPRFDCKGLKLQVRRILHDHRTRNAVEAECCADFPALIGRVADEHPVVSPEKIQWSAIPRPPTDQPRRGYAAG